MRKLAWFSLFFGVAVALFVGLLTPAWGLGFGCVCAVGCAELLVWRRGWSRCALAALGLAVGFLWTAGYDALVIAPVRALEGHTFSIVATLRDDPQYTQSGASVYADAEIEGHRCRLLLYLDEYPDARAGDQVAVTAALFRPKGESYELYYRAIGVDLIAYDRGAPSIVRADAVHLRTRLLRLRRALRDKISAIAPADAAPFLHAVLIGDRSGLSYAERNALNVSGIAHTVVISGLHISILLGLVMLLCGNRRELSAVIGIPIVILYTLMVGAQPSVVRAAVMQTVAMLSPFVMREDDPLTSLGVAALFILLPNPWAVANPSFQLSFGSMLGILLLSGRIYRALSAFAPIGAAMRHRLLRPLARYAVATVSSTCGACVISVLIIAWQFGVVSLLSVFTNLLTLWAVTLVFEGGLALCVLGFVWLWPAKVLCVPLAWLVRYVLAVARAITHLPLSAVYTQSSYMMIWLVFAYCLLGLCLWLGWRRLLLPGACVGVLSLCLCLWLGYFDSGRGELSITMLDVGQGQSVLFRDGDVTVMYDCGGDGRDKAGETAARFLLSQSVTEVDALILSHYDMDHAGGVCQLMERMPVDALYLPDLPCDTSLRAQIEAQAERTGTALHYVTANESLCFAATTVRIFAPVQTSNDNDASLALLYSKGGYDIFATGDLSASAERRLLSHNVLPDVELLVAGHHGAASSTCNDLLRLTSPETVLISVGAHNSYGHPSEDTLMRIYAAGAQVYRTDQCGTITIRR